MHRQAARLPRRLVAALTLLAASCGGAADGGAPEVVAVAAQPCDTPNRDRGAGVLVDDGLVLTAAHTVDGPRRSITVDGSPARLVDLDARTDLALLAADVDGAPAELATATPSNAVVRTASGERPVTIVRTGELVVDDVTADVRHRREVHTFTPTVTDGTSGAPLVAADGTIIGLVVLANRGDGTAYAVTGAEIATVLGRTRQPGRAIGCPG